MEKKSEELFKLAYEISKEVNKNQKKDEKTPYFMDLKEVLKILEEEFFITDNTSFVVACLHNIFENSDKYSYDDLVEKFNILIADSVKALTKTKNTTIEEYIKQLEAFANKLNNKEFIWKIKMAEILHNLRSLKNTITTNKEKVRMYVEEINKYYMDIIREIDFEVLDTIYDELIYVTDLLYSEEEKEEMYKKAMTMTEEELQKKVEATIGIEQQIYSKAQDDILGERVRKTLFEDVKKGHEYIYQDNDKFFLVTLNGDIELTPAEEKKWREEQKIRVEKILKERGIKK